MSQDNEREEDFNEEAEVETTGGTLEQVFAQLRRIMDHLGYLERKIDQLLANGPNQGGGGRSHFPRKDFGGRPPRREFGGGGGGRPPRREFGGGGRPPRREFGGGGDRPFFGKDRDRSRGGERGGDDNRGNREQRFGSGDSGGAPRHWKRESRGKRPH